MSVPRVTTANVVCTLQLTPRQYSLRAALETERPPRMPLNLSLLSLLILGLEYFPRQFSAGILRLHEPCITMLLFSSGNSVCTGARHMNVAKYAIQVLRCMLANVGIHADLMNVNVQNIVSNSQTDFLVDQQALWRDNQMLCASYQPDLFPGLVVRWRQAAGPKSKVVMLVFRTGRVVITGARSRRDARQAWSEFYTQKLVHYKDVGTTSSAEYCAYVTQRSMTHDVPVAALQLARGPIDP